VETSLASVSTGRILRFSLSGEICFLIFELMKLINFIIELFSGLAFFGDTESVKKGRLRQNTRELSRNRFARFYKPKSKELTGELGSFFHDIYKVTAPARILLRNATKSDLLKQTTVEYFLGKDTKEIEEILKALPEEWVKTGDIPTIVKTVNEKMTVFSSAFDVDTMLTIDHCYSNIVSFIHFINFDYSEVLKEFNPKISDFNIDRVPAFYNVCGLRLTDKIKNFIEIAFAVGSIQHWEPIIKILKKYRNDATVINQAQWNKILNRLHEINESDILEKIVMHIEEDPLCQFKHRIPTWHIAHKYLETKQVEVSKWLDTLISLQKNVLKKSMLIDVFGNADIQWTRFYTNRANEIYIKKEFEGFLYTDAINYLLAFLTDEFNTATNDLYSTLLIRGEWIMRETCKEMSENYYQLTELANKIAAFDSGFSDKGNYGSCLRTFFIGATPNNTRSINLILVNANEEALKLINTGIGLIMDISKKLNALSNDRWIFPHTLIGNWPKMDNSANHIVERIAASCTRINNFIRLMKFLIEDESSDDEPVAA
jgi:hypothetical protein